MLQTKKYALQTSSQLLDWHCLGAGSTWVNGFDECEYKGQILPRSLSVLQSCLPHGQWYLSSSSLLSVASSAIVETEKKTVQLPAGFSVRVLQFGGDYWLFLRNSHQALKAGRSWLLHKSTLHWSTQTGDVAPKCFTQDHLARSGYPDEGSRKGHANGKALRRFSILKMPICIIRGNDCLCRLWWCGSGA